MPFDTVQLRTFSPAIKFLQAAPFHASVTFVRPAQASEDPMQMVMVTLPCGLRAAALHGAGRHAEK